MKSIRDRVIARPDLDAARVSRDLDVLTAALNAQPDLVVQSRFITSRGIMSCCADGNAILDALDAAATANSAVRRAVKFLEQEAGLDIGDSYTQRMVDALVEASVLTPEQGRQLKDLALKAVYVDRLEVEAALYGDEK